MSKRTRVVMVVLELTTSASLRDLKSKTNWQAMIEDSFPEHFESCWDSVNVRQVTAQVAQPSKSKG